jgi:flagellar hook-length control protein FliK
MQPRVPPMFAPPPINTADTSVAVPAPMVPAAHAAASNPAMPNLVPQIHPAIHQAALLDRQMTITLRPPELGIVQIDILRHDGQLTARLQTETASAHQLLSDQLPQLREALTPWGVAGEQVQVIRVESPPPSSADFGQASGGPGASGGESSPQHDPQPRQQAFLPVDDEPDQQPLRPQFIRTKTELNLQV